MFKGSIVALITPFSQGVVDLAAVHHLVEWHIAEGTPGIVVCGSTGEGTLLTAQERADIITAAVETANKRIPIIVGCSTSGTAEAIEIAKVAKQLGADGILAVSPFYVKPSQDAMIAHFTTLHNAVDIPIILYNNPGRAVVEIQVDTVLKLAELKNVVALKDSTFDMSRAAQLRNGLTKSFSLLSGDDSFVAGYLAHGGDGIISVSANVAPRLCRQFMDAWMNKDLTTFQEINLKLMPLHIALGIETNPCSIKYAVSLLGKCKNELRLPLLPIKSTTETTIKKILSHKLGLISNVSAAA